MKKVKSLFFIIACVGFLFAACSDDESYADYVNKEKDRIKDFIKEHNIVVRSDYPSDGVFKENEFYQDPSGVYINVVDSGNGKRAAYRADVYYRFSGAMTLPAADADTINLSDLSAQPLKFQYGITTSYISSNTSNPAYWYLSPRIVQPLRYVGEGAVVRLIIPFRDYQGSSAQNQYYMTYYFDRVEYTSIIN